MEKDNRLSKERATSGLQLESLSDFLHGGKEENALRKRALSILIEQGSFLQEGAEFYDLTRAEKRELSFRHFNDYTRMREQLQDPELFAKILRIAASSREGNLSRYQMSLYFFGGAITSQGTQEQIDAYIPRLEALEISGCYCITELGTGSYVKAFQTTATFIEDSDEFEIHTPTLTATKWWVGNAAQTATHGVVIARLIIKGKDYGPHNFVVRLRDDNFDLCPGVAIGDVGPKRGGDATDNGWLQFDHVRIPRSQLLMKWSQVARDGSFTTDALPQISYGGLIGPRVGATEQALDTAKRAVVIASRYCIVRDQYSMQGKCLLDYMSQQERLIGALSDCYAIDFAMMLVREQLDQLMEELEQKNTENLKEVHCLVAAFKGFVTLWHSRAVNDCILALGGHSYSKLSDLPRLLDDNAPSIPYDGDALVLAQQTSSYLLKTAQAVLQGKAPRGASVQYLTALGQGNKTVSSAHAEEFLTLDELADAAMHLSLDLIRDAGTDLARQTQLSADQDEAWNACQLKLVSASKAHFMYTVIAMSQQILKQRLPKALGAEAGSSLDLLEQVIQLFAARHLQANLATLYESGYFPTSRGRLVHEQILALYAAIRPHVVSLTDAWDYHDRLLHTPLGRYDGDIYEHYFAAVNSLPQETKPSYWNEILKTRKASQQR